MTYQFQTYIKVSFNTNFIVAVQMNSKKIYVISLLRYGSTTYQNQKAKEDKKKSATNKVQIGQQKKVGAEGDIYIVKRGGFATFCNQPETRKKS